MEEKSIQHQATGVTKGFVFGKFMPLHQGHLALIDFAYRHCDTLNVVLCHSEKEPISGRIRSQWLSEELERYPGALLIPFQYDEHKLPNTSESSRPVSEIWANAFKTILPDVSLLFTSEPYGGFVAEFMKIKHIMFDRERSLMPVSASQIRDHPFRHWKYIADAAKSYFVKKVVLVGTESTGKTTLTEKLARHFDTVFVPEMAREIIAKTEDCTYDDLVKIAKLHAKTIINKMSEANKVLFADTDVLITKSYSRFLFGRELVVDPWIETTNKSDLYLFMDADCGYVQDGTRLSVKERSALNENHVSVFEGAGVSLKIIDGNWDQRFEKAVMAVEQNFF